MNVFFDPPAKPLTLRAFKTNLAKHGVRLNVRTQLLYDERHVFINGVALPSPADGAPALQRLADRRMLPARDAATVTAAIAALLYDWYRDGYLHSDA